MPEREITIEQLWQMVNKGIEQMKEKDSRLQVAEGRLSKLRQLIPAELKIPKPQEIPALIRGLREAIWGDLK